MGAKAHEPHSLRSRDGSLAAVEAARAGEQGRGFAVVAAEVRNLASRSATAAKEIKELIQDSVRKVDDGSLLVTQSGETLGGIVTSVKKVSDIVAEIAAASREQSSGIDQVNKAITQMDQMTQQNAALVEEATAASQSVADQARALNSLIAAYRVDDADLSEAGRAPVARQAAAPQRPERRGPGRAWANRKPVVEKAVGAPNTVAVANTSAAVNTSAVANTAAVTNGAASQKAPPVAAAAASEDSDWQEF